MSTTAEQIVYELECQLMYQIRAKMVAELVSYKNGATTDHTLYQLRNLYHAEAQACKFTLETARKLKRVQSLIG